MPELEHQGTVSMTADPTPAEIIAKLCEDMTASPVDGVTVIDRGQLEVLSAAITPPPQDHVEMPIASWREQAAFEEWAIDSRYEMTQHPLHYLFMDKQTNAARQGWKAALAFVRKLSEGK